MDHLFYACDGSPAKLHLRLAALFHDIGKPDAKKIIKEEVLNSNLNKTIIDTVTFYNHEAYSEKITKQILIRLRFSNELINKVCHLVKEHMFHYEANWTDAAVRRFIMRVSPENLDDLYDEFDSIKEKSVGKLSIENYGYSLNDFHVFDNKKEAGLNPCFFLFLFFKFSVRNLADKRFG